MNNRVFANNNSLSGSDFRFPKQPLSAAFDAQSHRKINRGNHLFLSGESTDKIFLVVQGRVKVGTYGSAGREITKSIYKAGDIIGEEGLMGVDKRHNFAYTLEHAVVASLPLNVFKRKLTQNHDWHLEIMQIIGQRLLATERRLESMVFKNSRSRIIDFIYQLGKKEGQRVGYEILVRKFITHQEIANITATSRQTVTTILNELRNDNIITFNRKRLLIRDMDRLAAKVL